MTCSAEATRDRMALATPTASTSPAAAECRRDEAAELYDAARAAFDAKRFDEVTEADVDAALGK